MARSSIKIKQGLIEKVEVVVIISWDFEEDDKLVDILKKWNMPELHTVVPLILTLQPYVPQPGPTGISGFRSGRPDRYIVSLLFSDNKAQASETTQTRPRSTTNSPSSDKY